jgi:hypothetical protein
MQKYTKDDGAIGVGDLERWLSDCNAATSVDELQQVSSTTFMTKLY